jgi:hypothetical protein
LHGGSESQPDAKARVHSAIVPEPRTSLDPRTSGNEGGESPGDSGSLPGELADAHEEILRLRDLLIGKDAELGRVKGRVAELEERLGRYTWLADKLRIRRFVSAVARRIDRARNRP